MAPAETADANLQAAEAARRASAEAAAAEAAKLKADLETALANWEPRDANKLSDAIEDVLDQLEKAFVA